MKRFTLTARVEVRAEDFPGQDVADALRAMARKVERGQVAGRFELSENGGQVGEFGLAGYTFTRPRGVLNV